MATWCELFCSVYVLICLAEVRTVCSTDNSKDHVRHSGHNEGVVRFNNPKLLPEVEQGYVFDTTQERPDFKKFGGINLEEEAETLALKLLVISNTEIGVTRMQDIYDQLSYKEAQPNYEETLKKLSEQLRKKLDNYLKALKTSKITIENLYNEHLRSPIVQRNDCCNFKQLLNSEDQYGRSVNKQMSCDLISSSVPRDAFNPGRNLSEVFWHNVQLIPSVKWQYFISTKGVYNEYPAHNFPSLRHDQCQSAYDTRHRDTYVSTVYPMRKNVVIMVDHGNSLSPNQFAMAKAVAKHVLLSLNENDRVAVLGLSSEIEYPRVDKCLTHKMGTLTYEAKVYYSNFLDNKLKQQSSSTNHTLGFEESLKMIWNTLSIDNTTMGPEQAMIVYVSRGLLSSLTEAKQVLDTIATWNGKMNNQVIINTCAVIDDGKPIMYEKSFLEDIAKQNYSKYLVEKRSPLPVPTGRMITVNNTRDLSRHVWNFIQTYNWSTSHKPRISLPVKDEITSGVVMAISWPCYFDDKLIGVVGFDIDYGDVVEGVTYYTQNKEAYAFIVDQSGFVVMHPSLARPIVSRIPSMHTDISHFENIPEFKKVRSKILRQAEGSMTIEVPRPASNTSAVNQLPVHPPYRYVYRWQHIQVAELNDRSPFIMVVRETIDGFKVRQLADDTPTKGLPENVYHRLDLLPTDHTCLHLKQLATLNTSSLFLAASAFIQPFDHLNQEETKRMVQGYLAFLNDNTDLISSPGIRDEVRRDVAALSGINEEWTSKFRRSSMNDFIIRRYVATPNGVFRMYPGTLLNKAYDPTKRDWYMRALEHPGKVTLTAPYLDAGGAGYIITMSSTIYEGRDAALHGPHDKVVAVMGMDVTLKYFYKLLLDMMPVCKKDRIRCFLMDDRGYLIAHEDLIDPTKQRPLEEKHITHKEPIVANDILNHKGLVRKKLCNSYTDRTMQRYYQFNTSLTGIVTNLVHGEQCARYLVTPVKGTNLFLGIVNQTCNTVTAFCPCSVIDRTCLNCKRMEQTECECPCECPLEMNFCTGKLLQAEDRNPSCPKYPEEVPVVHLPNTAMNAIPQCFQSRCKGRTSKSSCIGVMDCEWCEAQSAGDTVTPLSTPYCDTQRVCFGGVVGARTPYDDEVVVYDKMTDEEPFKSTPVGPVAGGLMGCFLVLALGVYCYRHHIHRQSHQYITSLPDSQMRMEQIEQLPDELEPQDDPGNGHTNIVLATFDINTGVSPYRMNPTYRRPTNAESDLGYSTMTPHEDSEQASTTCVEPLIIRRDRYRPPPHSAIAKPGGGAIIPPPPPGMRRSRSPTPPATKLLAGEQTLLGAQTVLPASRGLPADILGQTVLPTDPLLPNQVVANVQVHMVDTH